MKAREQEKSISINNNQNIFDIFSNGNLDNDTFLFGKELSYILQKNDLANLLQIESNFLKNNDDEIKYYSENQNSSKYAIQNGEACQNEYLIKDMEELYKLTMANKKNLNMNIFQNFKIDGINEVFQDFVNQIQIKLINADMLKYLAFIEDQFKEEEKKSKFCLSKDSFFKEKIKEFKIDETKEKTKKNLENKIEDLWAIYLTRDMKSLKNLLKISSVETFVTDYDIKSIKSKILFPKNSKIIQKNSIMLKENESDKLKKCFYAKIYFFLIRNKFEACFESIMKLMSNPNRNIIYDHQLINQILGYINKNTQNEELRLLINTFQSQNIEEIESNFDNYIQYIKAKCSSNNIEEILKLPSIAILKHSLNFQLLKNNQKQIKDENQINQQQVQTFSESNQNEEIPQQNPESSNNEYQSQSNSQDKLYLLSLDGGGVRGIIQLYFLVALEELTKNKCDDIFYFIGGCSIGGIIALCLRVQIPAKKILSFFIKYLRQNIFQQSNFKKLVFSGLNFFYEDYSLNPHTSLYDKLDELLAGKKFSQIKNNTIITSAYLDVDKVVPICFVKFEKRSSQVGIPGQSIQTVFKIKSQLNQVNQPVQFEELDNGYQYQDAPLCQIASSTSAAYPFFNKFKFTFKNNPYPDRQFLDGGYLFNNVDLLLIEFLKQIDTSYDQTNKLSKYVLISLDNSGTQISSQPVYKEDDTDDELHLPKTIFSIILNSESIKKKSQKNQEQSIYLTDIKQQKELFIYMRQSVPKFAEIELDDTQFETLDKLQLIGHQFIQKTNWQQISDILGDFQFIPKDISLIENLENDFQKDYETLNNELDKVDLDQIKEKNYQDFQEFYNQEGKQIESNLTKIIYNLKIKNNEVNVVKMNDPRNNIFEKGYQFLKGVFYDDQRNFLNEQFKGVLQLAAGIESTKTIKLIFTFLKEYKQEYITFLTDQIGTNKWNPLIAASANGRVRSFIYLIQYLQDQECENTKNFLDEYCIKKIQNNNRQKFNHMMKFTQYSIFQKEHQSILDIAPDKFRQLIDWWIQ
ncbi:hypothetical protein ABPG74_013338 [Tetrahymena malaccensis]